MITTPLKTREYLQYVVRAVEHEGFLGLMVVLARTAEARNLHQELTRDWTSIHDVTGHALAVLCPEPRFEREPGPGWGTENGRLRGVLRRAASSDIPPFDYTQLITPGLRRSPLPPDTPQLHHAAWTESVSRCAGYFGVPEQRLPALLVLCLREANDVLIQFREDTSIYELCKRIASHPGYPPEDGGLPAERERLQRSLQTWNSRASALQMWQLAPLPALQKQKEELRRHLDMVAHVLAPDLGDEVAGVLHKLGSSHEYVQVALAWLTVIADRVAIHPRRTELLDLHASLRSTAHTLATLPDDSRLRDLNHVRLADMERRLGDQPGLAEACEDAARAVLGDCEIEPLRTGESRTSLQPQDTERIRAVRPVDRPPTPAARDSGATHNTIVGTVHGSTVQARTIDALHLHIHADSPHATPPHPEDPSEGAKDAEGVD